MKGTSKVFCRWSILHKKSTNRPQTKKTLLLYSLVITHFLTSMPYLLRYLRLFYINRWVCWCLWHTMQLLRKMISKNWKNFSIFLQSSRFFFIDLKIIQNNFFKFFRTLQLSHFSPKFLKIYVKLFYSFYNRRDSFTVFSRITYSIVSVLFFQHFSEI